MSNKRRKTPGAQDYFRLYALQNPSRSLADAVHDDQFLADLKAELSDCKMDQALQHGLRVEGMFAYVAASLGQCSIVKQEDIGDVYCQEGKVLRPDYRVQTRDGWQVLIEVKNHYSRQPTKPFRMRTADLERLLQYSRLFAIDLRIAVYWARWGLWTLLAPDAFARTGAHASIDLNEAVVQNEMVRLGDLSVHGVPPWGMRVFCDPSFPQKVDGDGRRLVMIERVSLITEGKEVLDPEDRLLATFLLFYGQWVVGDSPANVDGDRLVSWDVLCAPEEAVEGQPFQCFGQMSQMISRQYNQQTTRAGVITRLLPMRDPTHFGVKIPTSLQNRAIRLWVIQMVPKTLHVPAIPRPAPQKPPP